jgi:beta-glucosidase-like glycosyl hydrolase
MNGQVLRSAWGWDGLIESDCGALTNIQTRFHYSKDGPGTAAAAMRGTCDVKCDTVYKNYLAKALASGDLDLQHVRDSVQRLLKHRMKLGLFDPINDQVVTKLTDPSVIHGPVHVQLAHEAAVQSIVLLQHLEGILPLDSTTSGKTLAVIGPLANLTDAFIGDYAAKSCPGSAPAAALGTNQMRPRRRRGICGPRCKRSQMPTLVARPPLLLGATPRTTLPR